MKLLAFLCLLLGLAAPLQAEPQVFLPRTGLTSDDLGLVVNDEDPLSRQVAAYYQQARGIPPGNVIHLSFPPGKAALSKQEFQPLKTALERQTPSHVQAYAVAWSQPYRVGCMSLTSALAFGYDERLCSSQCGPTLASPYFNAPSLAPHTDLKLRPAMLLAGQDFAEIKALIDRGVAADHRFPEGRAYLLSTSDRARNARAGQFLGAVQELDGVFPVEIVHADALKDRQDVLFYFTGVVSVAHLDTLSFAPGALADHLTSYGGQLFGGSQMSSLRWLEAGATASYGTVVEPCSHPQKFPQTAVAMFHYAAGASALEAYWKSVAWPGEGVFIGEPLARPFAPQLRALGGGHFELTAFSPKEARWRLERAPSVMGPYQLLPQALPIHRGKTVLHFSLPAGDTAVYRLRRD